MKKVLNILAVVGEYAPAVIAIGLPFVLMGYFAVAFAIRGVHNITSGATLGGILSLFLGMVSAAALAVAVVYGIKRRTSMPL